MKIEKKDSITSYFPYVLGIPKQVIDNQYYKL